MQPGREGEKYLIPVNQKRLIDQQASATIKTLIDAIVELVTNSDNSYRIIEQSSTPTIGMIDIFVRRLTGGRCDRIIVEDNAGGMTLKELEEALEFAGETSGFYSGHSVRGMLGKGLKEAILALGTGEITTIKDGLESAVEIWTDSEDKKHKYLIVKDSRATNRENGTTVSIEVTNDRIKAPGASTLYTSLLNHYALRDINRNENRRIQLRIKDAKISYTKPVIYKLPEGEQRISEDISIPNLGPAHIEIYESYTKLDYASYSPSSEAGILVKSNDVILDNRLFGYDNDELAHHFFGWIDCPGISSRIREGDLAIVDPSRSGLDWRYQICRELNNAVQILLKPLIDKKHSEIESEQKTQVSGEYKKRLNELCSLLNKMALIELEELLDTGRIPTEINTLIIKPDIGYSSPNESRPFSVYLPKTIISDKQSSEVKLSLSNVIGNIKLLNESVFLSQHPNMDSLLIGYFRISGQQYGDSAFIDAEFNSYRDTAEFYVRKSGHRKKSTKSPEKNIGGLFKSIEFDERTPNPIQRVSLSQEKINVYLNFAPTMNYLGPGGEGMDTEQGSLMLAELVSEAFCTEVARRRCQGEIIPISLGGEIDAYSSEINKMRKKYLKYVHKVIVGRLKVTSNEYLDSP